MGAPAAWVDSLLWATRCGVVVLFVAICVADVRARRIPNRLVAAGLLLAIAWQGLAPAGSGLFDGGRPGALGVMPALGGAAGAFAAFLALHVVKVMGAGDVKLAAFVGAVFGIGALPMLLLAIFAMGGVLAGARLLDRDRRRRTIENLRVIAAGGATSMLGAGAGPRFDPRADSADRLPFALAIVGGALVLAAWQWAGWSS